MNNLKKLGTVAMVSLILLLVAGCGNDSYDKLKVVDGNGRVLILTHNVGDTYYINPETPEQPTQNSEINANLKATTGK